MTALERGLLCGGLAFTVTFMLYPWLGRRISLAAGWATGALLLWATWGGK